MDFFKELLHEISYEDKFQGANLYQLITIISKRLNMDSTKKLLIVDEAGKFRPKYLEYFHEIRDNTESSTGIIFAGPEYFKENIMEWKNKGTRGIPELYRRINHWEVLDFPAK
jgi:hypothetical protein